jgi:hypothetical protein
MALLSRMFALVPAFFTLLNPFLEGRIRHTMEVIQELEMKREEQGE